MNVRDASFKVSVGMPATNSTITSAAIDTKKIDAGAMQLGNTELLVTAPGVSDGGLPNAAKYTYNVIHSDNADLSGAATLIGSVIVQTGIEDLGAPGSTKRVGLPSSASRYLGLQIVGSVDNDTEAVTATLELLF